MTIPPSVRQGGATLGRLAATAAGLAVLLVACGIGLRQGALLPPDARPATATRDASGDPGAAPIDLAHGPENWLDVDYSAGAAAAWWPKGESPILQELVMRGDLPAVADRVGPEPVVYRGNAGIGRYGGDLWRMVNDIDGVRLILQYELANNQLVRFSAYGEPIRPHLAKRVTPADDYRTWTVELRRGLRWSDGVPFTADDLVWWWTRVKLDPEVGYVDETMKVNGQVGAIEKIDDWTVRYTFPEPNPGWLRQQAGAAGALYMAGPRHYLRQFHPREGDAARIAALCQQLTITPKQLLKEKNHPLNPERPTLGPWMFRRHSTNGPWTAVRNPYYFAVDEAGNQLPYADRIVFLQINSQLQAKALTDGMVSYGMATGDYASLMSQRGSGGYEVRHWTPEERGRLTVLPNRQLPVKPGNTVDEQKRNLLRRREFRQALSLAIDREAIIASEFLGVGRPAALMPAPGVPWYDPELVSANATYEPDRAAALLDALGLDRRDADGCRALPDGAKLTLYLVARQGEGDMMQFLIDDWRAVGLRVVAQQQPHRLFLAASRYGDLMSGAGGSEVSWNALGAGAPYWEWYNRGGMYGSVESQAPGIDQPDELEVRAMRLGQDAGDSHDLDRRARLARDVMAIARDEVWAINIATPGPSLMVVKRGLHGVPDRLLSSFMLNSPNNGFPETWYWDDPATINGDTRPEARYLEQRRAAILEELGRAIPRADAAAPTAAPRNAGLWTHGVQGAVLVLVLLGLAVLVRRHPFVLRRLLLMIPTFTLISIIVFVGVQLPPGSYLETVMSNLERSGQRAQAEAEIAQLRKMYHLDEGLVASYCRWTGLLWFRTFRAEDTGLLQGNLGRSMANDGAYVTDLLGDRLMLTVSLSFCTILLTWLVSIPIGIYSAVRQYSVGDYVLTIGGFIGMCIPQFILALVLMLVAKSWFGMSVLGLFSSEYAMQPEWSVGKVLDLLQHLWLPALIVAAGGTAGMIRVLRANLLDELRKPYVTTARAKGLKPVRLLLKYPFRLALNPFVSSIGHLFPSLISGAAIVSIVLSLPTVGPLLLDAVMLEDTYMAGSLLLVLSALSVFGVLVSDLLLMALDPRIRMDGGNR